MRGCISESLVCACGFKSHVGLIPVQDQAAESAEMTKEQKAKHKMMETVAKHLRFKVPTKNAVIKGQKIEYFQGEEKLTKL